MEFPDTLEIGFAEHIKGILIHVRGVRFSERIKDYKTAIREEIRPKTIQPLMKRTNTHYRANLKPYRLNR